MKNYYFREDFVVDSNVQKTTLQEETFEESEKKKRGRENFIGDFHEMYF